MHQSHAHISERAILYEDGVFFRHRGVILAGRVRRIWLPLPLEGLIEFIASQAGVAEQQCCMEMTPISHTPSQVAQGLHRNHFDTSFLHNASNSPNRKDQGQWRVLRHSSAMVSSLRKPSLRKPSVQSNPAQQRLQLRCQLCSTVSLRRTRTAIESCVPFDCSQVTTAAGQCSQTSYAFCCGVGTPCICSEPPVLGDIIFDCNVLTIAT